MSSYRLFEDFIYGQTQLDWFGYNNRRCQEWLQMEQREASVEKNDFINPSINFHNLCKNSMKQWELLEQPKSVASSYNFNYTIRFSINFNYRSTFHLSNVKSSALFFLSNCHDVWCIQFPLTCINRPLLSVMLPN